MHTHTYTTNFTFTKYIQSLLYLRDAANDDPLDNTNEDSLYTFSHSATLLNDLRQYVIRWQAYYTCQYILIVQVVPVEIMSFMKNM